MIERHLMRARGNDEEAFAEGLKIAASLAESLGCGITIVVPRLSDADDKHYVLASRFKKEVVVALCRGESSQIVPDLPVLRLTSFSNVVDDEPHVILALHASVKAMDAIDRIRTAKAVVVVSWSPNELADWESKWGPFVRDFPFEMP